MKSVRSSVRHSRLVNNNAYDLIRHSVSDSVMTLVNSSVNTSNWYAVWGSVSDSVRSVV